MVPRSSASRLCPLPPATERKRVFGSTFTVPISVIERLALEWPSVTSVWPTPSLAPAAFFPEAFDSTCGVPATLSMSHPDPGVIFGFWLQRRIPTAATSRIVAVATANPKDQCEGKKRCQKLGG